MTDERLGDMGEVDVIQRLRGRIPGAATVKVGLGDDTAVVAWTDEMDLLLTSDATIHGVHVDHEAEPEAIGRKALARALSDIAAMGGKPLWAMVDLVAPATENWKVVEGIYRGLLTQAKEHGVALVGGDTSCSEPLALHIFVAGQVPRDQALLRSGALPGQAIYVTGRLGNSLAGRHLAFDPRLAEGQWLCESGYVSAMMDLSDGLATDLGHLARESGLTAQIREAALPLVSDAHAALHDGEDYELLFTVAPENVAEFEPAWSKSFTLECTRIGTMVSGGGGVMLEDLNGEIRELPPRGYEHF